MPIPKIEKPEQLMVNGTTPKRLIKVVKPYRTDQPSIMRDAVELARQAQAKREAEGEQ